MAVKTLTIKEKVYDELMKIKGEKESFSDLFERLAKKEKPNLMKYAGILSGEDARKIKKTIAKYREEFDRDFKKRETVTAKAIRRKSDANETSRY